MNTQLINFLHKKRKSLLSKFFLCFILSFLLVSLYLFAQTITPKDERYIIIGKRDNTTFEMSVLGSFIGYSRPTYSDVINGKSFPGAVNNVVQAVNVIGMSLTITFDPMLIRGTRASPEQPFLQDGNNSIGYENLGTTGPAARTVPFFDQTNKQKIVEADIMINANVVDWLPKLKKFGDPEDPRRVRLKSLLGMSQYYDPSVIIAHELMHSLGFSEPSGLIPPDDLKSFESLVNRIWIASRYLDPKPFPAYSPEKDFSGSYTKLDTAELKSLYPPASGGCNKKTQLLLTKSNETIYLSIVNSELLGDINDQILEPWINQIHKKTAISAVITKFDTFQEEMVKVIARDRTLVSELNSLTTKHIEILESQSTSSPQVFTKTCVDDIDHFIESVRKKSLEDLNSQLSILKICLPGLENKTFRQFLNQATLDNSLMNQINTVLQKQLNLSDVVSLTNYPNPSQEKTVISYNLPKQVDVRLKIFDSRGKELFVIDKGLKESGPHEVELNTSQLPSGFYFCVLEALNKKAIREIMVNH